MFDANEIGELTLNPPRGEDIGGWGIVTPQADCLTDIANKLGAARLEAEELNDKFFLYLIDIAIFHALEMREHQSDLGEREKWS